MRSVPPGHPWGKLRYGLRRSSTRMGFIRLTGILRAPAVTTSYPESWSPWKRLRTTSASSRTSEPGPRGMSERRLRSSRARRCTRRLRGGSTRRTWALRWISTWQSALGSELAFPRSRSGPSLHAREGRTGWRFRTPTRSRGGLTTRRSTPRSNRRQCSTGCSELPRRPVSGWRTKRASSISCSMTPSGCATGAAKRTGASLTNSSPRCATWSSASSAT